MFSVISRHQRRGGTPWRSSAAATSPGKPRSIRSRDREVDRRRRAAAVARQRGSRRSAVSSTCSGQRAHQPRAARRGQEVARGEQAALRVLPAHERLDADARGRRQAHLGLVVDARAGRVDRGAQVAEQRSRSRLERSRSGRRPRARCGAPWRGTSRRRRAASASASAAPCAGRCATPMLASTLQRRGRRPRSAGRARSRRAAATRERLVAVARRSSTANSSPPRRASRSPPRDRVLQARADRRSSRSPAWWPSESLTSLKPSRSISMRRGGRARRAQDRVVEPVVEQAPVRQPGQLVGHRLAAAHGQLLHRAEAEAGAQRADHERERGEDDGERAERPARCRRSAGRSRAR